MAAFYVSSTGSVRLAKSCCRFSEKENKSGLKAARGPSGAPKAEQYFAAFSPRARRSGNTTVARRDIPKVVGGLNAQASELAGALYGSIFHRTVTISSPPRPIKAMFFFVMLCVFFVQRIAVTSPVVFALSAPGARRQQFVGNGFVEITY